MEKRLEGVRLRYVYIKHMEKTRDRMRGSFVRQRQNSDSDEKENDYVDSL